ncbi:MAG: hypothetical protein Rubg2KO_32700 [Rubricoccaceae bacterium]
MRPAIVLCALLLAACDSGQDCMDDPRRITVQVVDEDGKPVKSLRTTLTNTRNLQAIQFTVADSLGRYTLLSDNNLAFVQRSGDVLTFEARNDTLFATAEFTIGREECHVALLNGPATIVAEDIRE